MVTMFMENRPQKVQDEATVCETNCGYQEVSIITPENKNTFNESPYNKKSSSSLLLNPPLTTTTEELFQTSESGSPEEEFFDAPNELLFGSPPDSTSFSEAIQGSGDLCQQNLEFKPKKFSNSQNGISTSEDSSPVICVDKTQTCVEVGRHKNGDNMCIDDEEEEYKECVEHIGLLECENKISRNDVSGYDSDLCDRNKNLNDVYNVHDLSRCRVERSEDISDNGQSQQNIEDDEYNVQHTSVNCPDAQTSYSPNKDIKVYSELKGSEYDSICKSDPAENQQQSSHRLWKDFIPMQKRSVAESNLNEETRKIVMMLENDKICKIPRPSLGLQDRLQSLIQRSTGKRQSFPKGPRYRTTAVKNMVKRTHEKIEARRDSFQDFIKFRKQEHVKREFTNPLPCYTKVNNNSDKSEEDVGSSLEITRTFDSRHVDHTDSWVNHVSKTNSRTENIKEEAKISNKIHSPSTQPDDNIKEFISGSENNDQCTSQIVSDCVSNQELNFMSGSLFTADVSLTWPSELNVATPEYVYDDTWSGSEMSDGTNTTTAHVTKHAQHSITEFSESKSVREMHRQKYPLIQAQNTVTSSQENNSDIDSFNHATKIINGPKSTNPFTQSIEGIEYQPLTVMSVEDELNIDKGETGQFMHKGNFGQFMKHDYVIGQVMETESNAGHSMECKREKDEFINSVGKDSQFTESESKGGQPIKSESKADQSKKSEDKANLFVHCKEKGSQPKTVADKIENVSPTVTSQPPQAPQSVLQETDSTSGKSLSIPSSPTLSSSTTWSQIANNCSLASPDSIQKQTPTGFCKTKKRPQKLPDKSTEVVIDLQAHIASLKKVSAKLVSQPSFEESESEFQGLQLRHTKSNRSSSVSHEKSDISPSLPPDECGVIPKSTSKSSHVSKADHNSLKTINGKLGSMTEFSSSAAKPELEICQVQTDKESILCQRKLFMETSQSTSLVPSASSSKLASQPQDVEFKETNILDRRERKHKTIFTGRPLSFLDGSDDLICLRTENLVARHRGTRPEYLTQAKPPQYPTSKSILHSRSDMVRDHQMQTKPLQQNASPKTTQPAKNVSQKSEDMLVERRKSLASHVTTIDSENYSPIQPTSHEECADAHPPIHPANNNSRSRCDSTISQDNSLQYQYKKSLSSLAYSNSRCSSIDGHKLRKRMSLRKSVIISRKGSRLYSSSCSRRSSSISSHSNKSGNSGCNFTQGQIRKCLITAVEKCKSVDWEKVEVPEPKSLQHPVTQKELNKALSQAVSRSDATKVRELLTLGANPNSSCGHSTLLIRAAKNGALYVLQALLSTGAEVDSRTDFGNSALHMAARGGHDEVVVQLVCSGADVDATNRNSVTPLQVALAFGHLEVAQTLLRYNADLLLPNKVGETALQIANQLGYTGLTGSPRELRRESIPGTCSESPPEEMPLAVQMIKGLEDRCPATVETCLKHGAAPNTIVPLAMHWPAYATVLHRAAHHGEDLIVQLLLNAGADINSQDVVGNTPLHAASQAGHNRVVKILLNNGADLEARSHSGMTPLHRASSKGKDLTCNLLIHRGGNTCSEDEACRTPADWARKRGFKSLSRKLFHRRRSSTSLLAEGDHKQQLQYLTKLHKAALKAALVDSEE